MNKYIYKVKFSSQFKRNLKKIEKQGKNIDILFDAVDKLANKEKLDAIYNNHKLKNDKYYKDCWECHLETTKSDWLLIYRYEEKELILLLISTGSHSDLFNK